MTLAADKINSPEYWDLKWRAMFIESGKILSRATTDSVLAELIPDRVSVGDFGCGVSSLLLKLKYQKKCNVMGYDFSNECVKYMNSLNIPTTLADITTFEPNGHKYHTMVVSHLLEHLEENDIGKAVKTVRDMSEVQAIFVVPQEKNKSKQNKEHKRIYTTKTLKQAVEPYFSKVKIHKIKPRDDEKDVWVNRGLVAQCLVEDRESDEVHLTQNRIMEGEIGQRA